MLHPTVWLGAPLDVLLNIAKWLSTKRILAFSRTCRYFHNSNLWQLAKECQYPDKPHLLFWSAEMNYFVAARDEFASFVNFPAGIIDYDIYEYHPMIEDVLDNIDSEGVRGDCGYPIAIPFKITTQYVLITYISCEPKYHASSNNIDELHVMIEKLWEIKPKHSYLTHEFAIIDLAKVRMRFWGYKDRKLSGKRQFPYQIIHADNISNFTDNDLSNSYSSDSNDTD
jgi:hypothetical protein